MALLFHEILVIGFLSNPGGVNQAAKRFARTTLWLGLAFGMGSAALSVIAVRFTAESPLLRLLALLLPMAGLTCGFFFVQSLLRRRQQRFSESP
jgi:hypothetical protein